jgi:Zn-dependent protease with chaperone function
MTRNPGALASALKKIHHAHTNQDMKEAYATTAHNSLRSLAYMYDPNALHTVDAWDINAWFSTHPSLQERLKALGE